MTLATDTNELTFIYTSESSIAKQALGYVKSSNYKANIINISETGLTGTQWSEIATVLGASLDELIAKDHPDVDNFAKDATMSDDHWIKFIQNNPASLQQPILIQGNRAKQLASPSQVLQFIEVDSAGLDKKNVGDLPTISPNTEEEHQV